MLQSSSQLTLSSGHKISALHSQSKLDAMVWSNILLIVSTSLQSKGSALASFSWQFNSEATIYTHASVPGCSAPNTLLLPATASQRKGSSLAALAWQRGQHVDRHQSIWTLSTQLLTTGRCYLVHPCLVCLHRLVWHTVFCVQITVAALCISIVCCRATPS